MKIIKNEKLIKRNGTIGQWTTLGGIGVLALALYLNFTRPDLVFYTTASLIVGFILTQVGMYFSSRWGRSPRPDELLDAALKGLPGDMTIYHYISPVPHLLIGTAGMWILQPYHQRGKVTYTKNRWRLSGGGFMQAYMSIFGQEGLGRPDTEVANGIDMVRNYFKKRSDEIELPEVHAALVFTNDQAEIDTQDAPIPVLKLKQLKDFFRQKTKERFLDLTVTEKLKSLLPDE
jgi:hypothetical protein